MRSCTSLEEMAKDIQQAQVHLENGLLNGACVFWYYSLSVLLARNAKGVWLPLVELL